MNKNFQYFNNRDKYKGICIPRRGEILNYLIKEKFLSEFSTDEEKQQVLYNLGILQRLDSIIEQINLKANISQLQDYVTLQYFLEKIQELKPHDEKAKGYYSSIEQLLQEYPIGEKGDWAIVNVSGDWYIYRYDSVQGWVQSETYDNNIDLTNYVTQDILELYQSILVSGQNIKTINGESILGSGNIEILADSEGLATKQDLELYVSKEELYNIQNPLKLTLSISSTLLEYTGNPYTIRITAQAKKGNNNVNADSYQISFNSTTAEFNGEYETTISNKGITSFNVTCTLGEETAAGRVQVNLVLPTYIGFYNSSNYSEVDITSFTKRIKDSISMTETIENTVAGSYLWIVTPLNLNSVATDPGFTYKVETTLAGSINGIKYYRSNSAIDVSNLTYYIK